MNSSGITTAAANMISDHCTNGGTGSGGGVSTAATGTTMRTDRGLWINHAFAGRALSSVALSQQYEEQTKRTKEEPQKESLAPTTLLVADHRSSDAAKNPS